MKQTVNKLFLLAIVLTLCVGIMTACGSTAEKSDVGSAAGGSAQNGTAANEKTPAENKTAPNKNQAAPQPAALIEVYDGRKIDDTPSPKEASAADTTFVENEFKRNETAIKQKLDNYCNDPDDGKITIYNSVEGAFTKPDSKQKAFLYSRCELGRGFGVGGIMIVENGTVAAHYVGQISWSELMSTLPDINKNGITEIVLSGGGTGQGYTSASIYMLELKSGQLDFLGETDTYSDNSGAAEDDSKVETIAYKISVEPSATPVFFRETYEKKGNAKTWTLSKKSEKFSLSKEKELGFSKVS